MLSTALPTYPLHLLLAPNRTIRRDGGKLDTATGRTGDRDGTTPAATSDATAKA